ncbi:MAG: CPBP family intramembrane metalloprotease [Anaerolineae bacterium]|nr:CPBP family intramembrane metalloprotease [Anaerolineae bacterium]
MDVFTLLIIGAVIIGYIGTLLFKANQAEATRTEHVAILAGAGFEDAQHRVRQQSSILLYMLNYGVIAILVLFPLMILLIAVATNSPAFSDQVGGLGANFGPLDMTLAVSVMVIGILMALISLATLHSAGFRMLISKVTSGGFNPLSQVHIAGVGLMMLLLVITIGQLAFLGGLSGLATQFEQVTVGVQDLIFQMVLFIAVAFLAIGFAIRRNLTDSLQRLGLRLPTLSDVAWGVAVGLGLYGVLIVLVTAWSALVPPEVMAEQTAASELLARSFNTLPLAFAVAFTAAVGEEILFRGALQPIFGLILSSVYFVLVHIQYTLTPATLIILVVSLGLGVLRKRQSTTACIIAHFVYNFVQLALAVFAVQFLGGAGT